MISGKFRVKRRDKYYAVCRPVVQIFQLHHPSIIMGLLETYFYQTLAALFFGCILLFRLLKKSRSGNPNGLPLPPGPKGYPLIGSLFDMPLYWPWLVYDEWCKTYGDMVYFKVLGLHFLILGSYERTTDLFEKRSSNYSDRLRLPMALELMKWDFNIAILPYGEGWRRHRKSFHRFFNINVVSKYQPIQRRAVRVFLRRLLDTPEDFLHHVRHNFGATIMDIAYGIKVQESGDEYISLAEEVVSAGLEASIPGAFLVDLFPILLYVPSWFPGAGFKKKAALWRKLTANSIEKPFRYVQEQLKIGGATPSVAATLIEQLPDEDDPQRPMEEKIAQNVAGVAYIGGVDTTMSAVQTLFLAMTLYPEVQKKAQAEIDAVVGPHRLPDFEDRPSLPYINAIVKESMRWYLVFPLSIPHMATNDDEYDGYYIPKGTVVFGSAWSILHDPKFFNNPMEFQPERYLKDGKLNPDVVKRDSVAFGYGRRICPGRHLSDNSLYLIASCLLAVYDIKPPVDDQGNVIKPILEFTGDILSHPIPFKCSITPRTRTAESLIRDSVKKEY